MKAIVYTLFFASAMAIPSLSSQEDDSNVCIPHEVQLVLDETLALYDTTLTEALNLYRNALTTSCRNGKAQVYMDAAEALDEAQELAQGIDDAIVALYPQNSFPPTVLSPQPLNDVLMIDALIRSISLRSQVISEKHKQASALHKEPLCAIATTAIHQNLAQIISDVGLLRDSLFLASKTVCIASKNKLINKAKKIIH